ncbi:hypothetical protein SteCoe_10623 [Stentor coeruleus]|uniref:Uncharacterized protein n=1 Tax=Stentor coeruleus TaxID=5963 RepID=A0A1R2CF97_9CILI|nr:hypothetical protein SteCoe_10623 [Stentor coeruleus]
MRLAEYYPAKFRFYSPGRSQAWKKFSSVKTQTKNFVHTQKVRGISTANVNIINSQLVKEVPNSGKPYKTNQKPYTHIKYPPSTSNSPIRSVSPVKIASKGHDYFQPIREIPKKYSLSSCLGAFDIKGQQMPLKTVNNPMSVPRQEAENIKKQNANKKSQEIYFRLPAVCTPTPWTYDF